MKNKIAQQIKRKAIAKKIITLLQNPKIALFLLLSSLPMLIFEFLLNGFIFGGIKKILLLLQTICAFLPTRQITYYPILFVRNFVEKIRLLFMFPYFIFILCLQYLLTLRNYDLTFEALKHTLEYKP